MLIKANPFGYCHNFILGKFFNNFFFFFCRSKTGRNANAIESSTTTDRRRKKGESKTKKGFTKGARESQKDKDGMRSTEKYEGKIKAHKKEKVERKEEKIV